LGENSGASRARSESSILPLSVSQRIFHPYGEDEKTMSTLLVDDDPLVRQVLQTIFERVGDIRVIRQAINGSESA